MQFASVGGFNAPNTRLFFERDAVKRSLIKALRQEVVAKLPKALLEMGLGVRMGIL